MSKIQVCLTGIQKYSKDKQIITQLKQLLGDQYIEPLQIVKPKMKPFCFLSFETQEQKDKFSILINNTKLRVNEAHNTDHFERQLEKKQKKEYQQKEQLKQRENLQLREPFVRDVSEMLLQTAPLNQMSYEEQKKYKDDELQNVLRKYRKQYHKRLVQGYEAPQWLQCNKNLLIKKIEIQIGQSIMCEKDFYNYRNKSEFTVSYNSQNEISVGFNVGEHVKNNASVERPNGCVLTPKVAVDIANKLENYIKQSPYGVFNRITQQGLWRMVQVRRSDITKELIISISISKNQLNEEQLEQLKKDLIDLLKDNQEFKLQGIVLLYATQQGSDIPNSLEDTEVIYGQGFYHEIILGKKICISFNAFLQNHTPQCERMYQKIIELCKLDKKPKFLDLCAGSGTIGICINQDVDEVIAVEMNQLSCEDAKKNYELNNVNARIICAKVEDAIKQIVKDVQKCPIVACLDPPRAGVQHSVVEALRTCRGLDKIIYVSCSPYSVIDNLIYLTLPESKKHRAPGFKIVSATLVDMFPQTNHFETIFHLERDYLI